MTWSVFLYFASKKSKLQCKMMTASDGERMCHLKYMVTPDWPCYPFRDDTGKCYPLGAADEHIGTVLSPYVMPQFHYGKNDRLTNSYIYLGPSCRFLSPGWIE